MDVRSEAQVFSDLTVVAFGWAMVGPLTLKYFADFGATVIRVESIRRPCVTRTAAPFKDGVAGLNRSGYYNHFSANMLSVAIDMNRPAGLTVAKELIARADVVMENFTPGVMDRWGLGYEQLKSLKPDIIMARQNGFGVDGPYRNLGAFGMILAAIVGIPNFIGWPDRGPLPAGISAYTDCISPRFMAAALMGALEYRNRTGCGQLLELAQFETAISFFLPGILDFAVNGREPERLGNHDPHATPHNVYACRGQERWCSIAVLDDRQWADLCEAMGQPELAADPRFDTLERRKVHEDELDAVVAKWTADLDAEEVMARLQARRVPAGQVSDARDVFSDPQLRHRGLFWTLEHPEMGAFTHLGNSIQMSQTPPRARRPSPCLGEHTEYVLSTILGKSDDEVAALLASGALE